MSANIYSLDDVSKHNTKNDLWLTIHDKVYNITEFALEHPGGEEVLFDEAGKDATEAFEDIGHSDEAREILEKYLIGELDEASKNREHKFKILRAGELPKETKSSGYGLRVILPALALIGILTYKLVLAPQQK